MVPLVACVSVADLELLHHRRGTTSDHVRVQSWMHMAGWECAVTYDFQDASRMDSYADSSALLPTGWKGYGACVFERRVNETAGTFTCPDSLKVVRPPSGMPSCFFTLSALGFAHAQAPGKSAASPAVHAH